MTEKDPESVAAVYQVFAEKFDLEQDESRRVVKNTFTWLKAQEANFGNIGVEEQVSTDRLIQGFARSPGFFDWWELSRDVFNRKFVRHVDALVEN